MPAPQLLPLAVDAMCTHGLLPEFPQQVVAEAEAMRHAEPAHAADLRDLRHLTWFSIDNADTRDLDQLSVVEPLADGAVRLLVAVADVDVLVAQDSAIDQHAAINTTSVYTAAGVFSMLPEVPSTDLTSLGQGQARAAVVVHMAVQADGGVGASELYRALVVNRAKLTYDEVSAWLDRKAPLPGPKEVAGLEQQLRVHDEVAAGREQLAHSTAPNRRYPDLVTQRLVKAAIAGQPSPYDFASLQAIARHCTEQEGHANAVERQVLKAAATFLLQGRIGDTVDAIVTGAAPKGTYVRIAQPLLEGRLVQGFEDADVGDALRVRLVALDPQQGHIDFECA